ncbi:HAD family hydrolase [Paenalcaligenes sp. Me131]|uniref:HAD family hydrolase n=1 Tax=Paenalcaligenes sp. Me131 TaxID=3392636 RepID=UPI003D2A0FF2
MIKGITRCATAAMLLTMLSVVNAEPALANSANVDPLPSWNEGRTKSTIFDFVQETTTEGSKNFVQPQDRIATFDQDGTLWVEHPLYTQYLYILSKTNGIVQHNPSLAEHEPFKTILSGDMKKISELSNADIFRIAIMAQDGMSVEDYSADVVKWLETARDPRWNRPYTDLIYQPMLELMEYLRENGYKTYIVTGGGQDFVRTYSDRVYGIPPEQIAGTSFSTQFKYDKDGKAFLALQPSLFFNDDFGGKAEGIGLFIGKRPHFSAGNSTGDREMLEYTTSGDGARLGMLVFHDDAQREYAYGPAQGLPASNVGTFSQSLYDEATTKNWSIISMKNDWKTIFKFEQ